MTSFRHQILVELFRRCGRLAPELLRRCAGIELDHDRIELGSIDLSQVTSPEYRADSLVVLYDRTKAGSAVIVEVQLGRDPVKRRSWPVYVTVVRAELDRSTMLLVITNKRKVARWARRPIETGHPGFVLRPIVLGFEDIPRIIDPEQGRKLPELAVLSAIAHRDLEVAEAAIAAIADLPEDQKQLYLDVILSGLPTQVRKILESRMQRQYENEFARRHYALGRSAGRSEGRQEGREEGRQEGREEGRQEGREEGRQEGREEALRNAVLVLARARLAWVTAEEAAAIAALHDDAALAALIGALGRAGTPDDARAVLDAAIARHA